MLSGNFGPNLIYPQQSSKKCPGGSRFVPLGGGPWTWRTSQAWLLHNYRSVQPEMSIEWFTGWSGSCVFLWHALEPWSNWDWNSCSQLFAQVFPGTGWSKLYIVLIHTLSFLQLVNTNVSIYKIDLKSLVFRPVCDHARRACANLFGVVFTHINV